MTSAAVVSARALGGTLASCFECCTRVRLVLNVRFCDVHYATITAAVNGAYGDVTMVDVCFISTEDHSGRCSSP